MVVEVRNIIKSFGAGNVLDGVTLEVRGGEVLALLGENGAGKSTLMNIVGGIYPPNEGEILVDGTPVTFRSPAAAKAAGIAFIHQELNLIGDLSVAENLFLPDYPKKRGFIDRAPMRERTLEIFSTLGVGIDPDAPVRELDAAYKQMIEIARALRTGASIIIMDEPTASLNPPEIARVFAVMRRLKEQGIGMIFISHKLDEVKEISDRFAVLQGGKCVATGATSDVTANEIAAYMVGHEVAVGQKKERQAADPVLTLSGLSDGERFFDVSLSVGKGEILGVTGLLGDGRSEVFGTVFGLYGKDYTGEITLNGKKIHPKSSTEALRLGIAYLPKNRKENGITKDLSILDNATLPTMPRFTKAKLIRTERQRSALYRMVEELHIKMADENRSITALSGGNQQKVVLAKWLIAEPQVLILDNPTQGVDVGAKEEIYTIIENLAATGLAVVVLSSEAAEIARLCHRALVMVQGRVAGEVSGADMNEKNMMQIATGAKGGENRETKE